MRLIQDWTHTLTLVKDDLNVYSQKQDNDRKIKSISDHYKHPQKAVDKLISFLHLNNHYLII